MPLLQIWNIEKPSGGLLKCMYCFIFDICLCVAAIGNKNEVFYSRRAEPVLTWVVCTRVHNFAVLEMFAPNLTQMVWRKIHSWWAPKEQLTKLPEVISLSQVTGMHVAFWADSWSAISLQTVTGSSAGPASTKLDHPKWHPLTWCSNDCHPSSQIDHILVGALWVSLVQDCRVSKRRQRLR